MPNDTPTLLQKTKKFLRISTTAFDDEIAVLIAAGKANLQRVGVSETVLVEETMPELIQVAVMTYVKLHFGEPTNPDKLETAYNAQVDALAHSTEYHDYGQV